MRLRESTWIVGGAGLIAAGLAQISYQVTANIAPLLPIEAIGSVLYSGSLLVMGIGFRQEDSVLRRRPLGLIAIVIFSIWTLLDAPLVQDPTSAGALSYLSLLTGSTSALIAAVQIARASVIPAPWRWAPLWVIGVQGSAWILPQIALTASSSPQAFVLMSTALGSIALVAGTIGLGALALVLDSRRTRRIEVFRSSR